MSEDPLACVYRLQLVRQSCVACMLHWDGCSAPLAQTRTALSLMRYSLQDFVFDSGTGQAGVRVLGVCDGHYGKGAAAYVSSHFLSELQDRLSIDSHAGTSCFIAIVQWFLHGSSSLMLACYFVWTEPEQTLLPCADRETTAAELRHAITRTFIKLAECFERSKKISGEQFPPMSVEFYLV